MSTFPSLLIDKEKDSIKSYKNNEYSSGNPHFIPKQKIIDK